MILTLNSLEVPPVVNLLGVKLELVCCVEKLNQSSMRTHFKKQNQFYTAERNEMPQKSELDQSTIKCLAIYSTTQSEDKEHISAMSQFIFQKNTLDNMSRRQQKFDDKAKFEKRKQDQKEAETKYRRKIEI